MMAFGAMSLPTGSLSKVWLLIAKTYLFAGIPWVRPFKPEVPEGSIINPAAREA